MMNFIRRYRFLRIIRSPKIVSAFWSSSQPPFSTTTHENHSPSSSASPEVFGYLINSGLFSLEGASQISRRLRDRVDVQNAKKVVDFLRETGFTDTQIQKSVSRTPLLLSLRIEEMLMPKMVAFQNWGLSASDIAQMIASNPRILTLSLENYIVPIAEILKTFLHGNGEVNVKSIKCFFSRLLISHNVEMKLTVNLSVLQSCGVPESYISTSLVRWPSSFTLNPSRFERMIEKTHKLGFDYSSAMFLQALCAVSAMRESVWNAKVDALRGFGWSEDDVVAAFQKAPLFLKLSESHLRKKLEFFKDELGHGPSELVAAPYILTISLEKRIIPRLSLIKRLESAKILNTKPGFHTIMQMTEKEFYEKVVLKYKDACPDMFEAYKQQEGRAPAENDTSRGAN